MSKYLEFLLQIFVFLILVSLKEVQEQNTSLSYLSQFLVKILNGYISHTKKVIQINDSYYLTFTDFKAAFQSNPPIIDHLEETIDYYNVNVTFVFTLKIDIVDNVNETNPNITLFIKNASAFLKFPVFNIVKNVDNSLEYEYSSPTFTEYKFGNIEEYLIFQFLIEKYSEKAFKYQIERMWRSYIDEMLVKYPSCNAKSNFIIVNKKLIKSGVFSVSEDTAPNFTKIKFLSLQYDSIELVNPFSRKFSPLTVEIEYYWDGDFHNSFVFDFVTFTQKSIIFGKMKPENSVIELIIRKIFYKALKSSEEGS